MEEQAEKLKITLHLYDTDIKVTVDKDKEEAWRRAASLFNERMNAYFSIWKNQKSDKEINYYAMFDLALRCVNAAEFSDDSPVIDILNKLSSEIDDALK